MKEVLRKLGPEKFEDLIALNALYRPGPMRSGMIDEYVKRKHGEVEITYPVAQLERLLKSTYGVIVYQEQVMQIGARSAASPSARPISSEGRWGRRRRR